MIDREFEDGLFDCVIDKGTFDTVLCGDGSDRNSEKFLGEVYRILKPQKSVYICVSYGFPEEREFFFWNSKFEWDLVIHRVAKPTVSTVKIVEEEDTDEKNFHYIYVMRKKQKSF